MVPPRSFARTTTTAARILSTILLRASLRIRPNSQSISQFSYLFQYLCTSLPSCSNFLPSLDPFLPPLESVMPPWKLIVKKAGPSRRMPATEFFSSEPLLLSLTPSQARLAPAPVPSRSHALSTDLRFPSPEDSTIRRCPPKCIRSASDP